jgi:hypothetical protein
MAFLVKVEGLHAGVSYQPCREHYFELLQALATRSVAGGLFRFKIRIRENDWGRDIIPDQIATIAREL